MRYVTIIFLWTVRVKGEKRSENGKDITLNENTVIAVQRFKISWKIWGPEKGHLFDDDE